MLGNLIRKILENGFYITILFMLLAITLPKEDPWVIIKGAIKEIYKKRDFYKYIFGAIIIYFIIDILETKFDHFFTSRVLKTDFTHVIYFIEGNLIGKMQRIFKNTYLTYFLTYIYIFTFPIQFFLAISIYIYRKMYKMSVASVVSLGLNYFFVLPFYIFFPVQEVWFYNSKAVEFLAPYAYPYISMEYRNLSGIDNCFPSFHTSMAFTMILLARYSQIKSLYYITLFFSVCTIISTMYLGIHWVTDVGFGILVGWIATLIGIRYAHKKMKMIKIS